MTRVVFVDTVGLINANFRKYKLPLPRIGETVDVGSFGVRRVVDIIHHPKMNFIEVVVDKVTE